MPHRGVLYLDLIAHILWDLRLRNGFNFEPIAEGWWVISLVDEISAHWHSPGLRVRLRRDTETEEYGHHNWMLLRMMRASIDNGFARDHVHTYAWFTSMCTGSHIDWVLRRVAVS